MNFEIDNLRDGYVELVRTIHAYGDEVKPRGLPTRELLNATVTLKDPHDALPVGVGRYPNLAIAAAEAIQLIGGFSDPGMMESITTNFAQFFDGSVLHGAYGPRIRTQLASVVNRLREDPDTRQAIATIWDPLHDGFGTVPKDLPCTLVLHFVIRNGKLSLMTTMRSNDVWWGVAYDFFQFTQLQLTIAHILQIPAGPYYHHASSLHLYERDFEAAAKLHPFSATTGTIPIYPHGLGVATVEDAQSYAHDIWALEPIHSPNAKWYQDLLRNHVRAARLSPAHAG